MSFLIWVVDNIP